MNGLGKDFSSIVMSAHASPIILSKVTKSKLFFSVKINCVYRWPKLLVEIKPSWTNKWKILAKDGKCLFS